MIDMLPTERILVSLTWVLVNGVVDDSTYVFKKKIKISFFK